MVHNWRWTEQKILLGPRGGVRQPQRLAPWLFQIKVGLGGGGASIRQGPAARSAAAAAADCKIRRGSAACARQGAGFSTFLDKERQHRALRRRTQHTKQHAGLVSIQKTDVSEAKSCVAAGRGSTPRLQRPGKISTSLREKATHRENGNSCPPPRVGGGRLKIRGLYGRHRGQRGREL